MHHRVKDCFEEAVDIENIMKNFCHNSYVALIDKKYSNIESISSYNG